MFGDVDWPLNVSRGFVSIILRQLYWRAILTGEFRLSDQRWYLWVATVLQDDRTEWGYNFLGGPATTSPDLRSPRRGLGAKIFLLTPQYFRLRWITLFDCACTCTGLIARTWWSKEDDQLQRGWANCDDWPRTWMTSRLLWWFRFMRENTVHCYLA